MPDFGYRELQQDLSDDMGERYLFSFENGWGASVIRNPYSYGGMEGFWELAVWHGPQGHDDAHLCYQSDVTDDVVGHLSDREVKLLLDHISTMAYVDWHECPDRDALERALENLKAFGEIYGEVES